MAAPAATSANVPISAALLLPTCVPFARPCPEWHDDGQCRVNSCGPVQHNGFVQHFLRMTGKPRRRDEGTTVSGSASGRVRGALGGGKAEPYRLARRA